MTAGELVLDRLAREGTITISFESTSDRWRVDLSGTKEERTTWHPVLSQALLDLYIAVMVNDHSGQAAEPA